ncbi:FeoA family protein [Acidovorax soli]|uniref:Ferrous iron transport protein A n=1 Tax=Acidovorax soli TaxID=592050 RepID=A0A1H3W130_9BURK|nr:ferrous iron transport protein A [Acidovorax soli]
MKPLTDLSRSDASVPSREHSLGLADLPLWVDAWVSALHMDAAPQDGDVLLRLLEIGFLPGEPVRVVARAFPAGDPLAVRVGRTTFALRRREAALVRVSTTAPVGEVAA